MMSASDHQAMIFRLSNGQIRDAPEGCVLLENWDNPVADTPLAMDRARDGDETRSLVETLGMTPAVPPKANRKADGTATADSTSCGTRSSDCSDDSRAAGASAHGSTSSTRCS